MVWEIEYTDEFNEWWETLSEKQKDDVFRSVGMLEQEGPALNYPYSSKINGSRHSNMRELRTQSGGGPLRTFYAFDPRRNAILLIGGDKTGDDRFYQVMVPRADKIYDDYLRELKEEAK
jgi:hypothetical protein